MEEAKMKSLLLLFIVAFILVISGKSTANETKSPIVGILMQETEGTSMSELSGTYVNFLHAAGCRAAPILIDQNPDYYESMFNSINGIIFPGGYNHTYSPYVPEFKSSLYYKTAKLMFDKAVAANDRGDYFPIFASCMGCETFILLNVKQYPDAPVFGRCDAYFHTTNLDFKHPLAQMKKTRLFQYADTKTLRDLAEKQVQLHGHTLCLTEQNLTKLHLDSTLRALSTNFDKNGMKFISTMEAKKHPFSCVFIHPEVTLYSTNRGIDCDNIVRSKESIETSQYFTRFVFNEAKKSKHSFKDKQSERKSLIFSYEATNTPDVSDCAPQTYFIPVKTN